jgi:hypothetical protein
MTTGFSLLLVPAGRTGSDGSLLALASSGPGASSFLIVLGVLLLVSLAVFIWAAFFRKYPRRRHSHHHWKYPKPPDQTVQEAEAEKARPHGSRFRFWRRHRRPHKKRLLNPTLAETGGLPPARASESEPPPTL